jgi:hypothetical protein
MAFTIASAYAKALTFIDVPIEEADAILWATEFVRTKVGSEYFPEDTEEYEDTTSADLPDGFLSVISVTDSKGNAYTRYTIRSGKIAFATAGDYTLAYRAEPVAFTDIDDECALPSLYSEAMAKFIASRQRSQDDSDDPDAQRKMLECDSILSDIFVKHQTQEAPPRIRGWW